MGLKETASASLTAVGVAETVTTADFKILIPRITSHSNPRDAIHTNPNKPVSKPKAKKKTKKKFVP